MLVVSQPNHPRPAVIEQSVVPQESTSNKGKVWLLSCCQVDTVEVAENYPVQGGNVQLSRIHIDKLWATHAGNPALVYHNQVQC